MPKLIKIIVKKLDSKKETIEIDAELPVSALKKQLADKVGIDSRQINLIFKGKPLLENETIEALNICDGDMVHMILQLHG